MSAIEVIAVSNRRQQKQFLELPWQIYRDYPNWVPPLRFEQKELVGYRPHPFYMNNRVQTFLAYRGQQPCGRIAAILNRDHIEYRKEQLGFFGFFECVDDQQAADALFDAVRQWFAARDIHAIRGPANPGMNYVWGLLVEGFDLLPTMMMPYNPPYYARLLEGAGFRKSQDLYAYWGHIDMLPASTAKVGPVAEQIIQRYDIRLRCLDPRRFQEDVEAFLSIYNRSMTNQWNFTPMSPDEVRHTAKGLRHLLVPELALAAEIDGRWVGVVLCLPDFNPIIKKIDGHLFPFGFLRLLWNKRRIKKVRLMSTNVVPEYHLLGIGLVLVRGLVPAAMKIGLTEVEYSWVAESNSLSRGSIEKSGAKLQKTYRMYDWHP
jgi:hypothetical protein